MLFELDVLHKELRKRYSHPEYDLSDLCLVSPGENSNTISACERELGVTLPQSFINIVIRFDFSRLSLGNLAFAYGPNLEKFLRANVGEPYPWWGTGPRPMQLLLVGTTDGHILLMSIETGAVQAMPKTARTIEERFAVATDFEVLVRTAGSIALGTSCKDRTKIATSVSSSLFWQGVASGTA